MACSSRHTKGLLHQLAGLRQPTIQVLFQKCQVRDSTTTNQQASLSSSASVAREPLVIATEGKWVRVKGHAKPLINFTSRDVFGIQNHPLLDKAEMESVRIDRNVHVHPSHKVTIQPEQHLQRTLAQLHGKDDIMLTSQSFDITLRMWLGEMLQEGGIAYVPEDFTRMTYDTTESIHRYTDIKELEEMLAKRRKACASGQQLVIMEAGVTESSVQQLREVCRAAERQFATVVLLDPHGISHVRAAMGESEETLRVLRRPAIIQTSLSVLSGNNTGCYLTGTRKHVTSCRNYFTAQSQVLSDQSVRRILKAIELLPARRLNAQIANIHSLSLRLQLEGARIGVGDAGMALSVHVEERTVAETVSEALRRKGFHVDLIGSHQNDFELQFSVNGYHTADDIANFRIALLHELHKNGVIASPSTTNKQPGISYAFIDRDSNGVQEIVTYRDIIKFERRHQSSTETYPRKLFHMNHSDVMPRVLVRNTLLRLNTKSTVPREVQELGHLSDVYCWSEKDVSESKEIYDNVMWASPLPVEDGSDVTKVTKETGVSSKSVDNSALTGLNVTKASTNIKLPTDMRYLENLYCTPMFDDALTETQDR